MTALALLVVTTVTACGDDSTAEPSSAEPSSGAGVKQVDDTKGPGFRWTGNGQRTLGTIKVEEPSILRWRNDTGYSFALG